MFPKFRLLIQVCGHFAKCQTVLAGVLSPRTSYCFVLTAPLLETVELGILGLDRVDDFKATKLNSTKHMNRHREIML